jgi:hypothetical protein
VPCRDPWSLCAKLPLARPRVFPKLDQRVHLLPFGTGLCAVVYRRKRSYSSSLWWLLNAL